jgi:membrane fusion protein, multidrug efflux system
MHIDPVILRRLIAYLRFEHMTENKPIASGERTAPDAGSHKHQPHSVARVLLLFMVGALLTVGFFYGLRYTVRTFTHESTDDAFIQAHVVSVAPRIAGQIQAVHVNDNQLVKKGDALLELDPRDYEMRLAQKRDSVDAANANLDSAKAGLALMKARLETAEANQRQEKAHADSSRATADRAQSDLKRYEILREKGVVSAGEFDRVSAEAESAMADRIAGEQKADAATSQVAEARAQVSLTLTMVNSALTKTKQAGTDKSASELDLSYTRIAAPCDGRVTRKAVEPGDYVQVGQSLLALVPTNVWIVANFKETQLADMRPGQLAEIHIDAYPDKNWHGHVDSIMAGSGASFSMLPPENAVGNFVKVVQRVPVKILFDDPPEPDLALGPGMSVIPLVRTSTFALPNMVLWAGALVLAVLATLGLVRVIAHLQN